jgi:hypothetical protein
MNYRELKQKHQEEYNAYFFENGFAAFNPQQFVDGYTKLGLTPGNYASMLVCIGCGCYVLKIKHGELRELFARQKAERKQCFSNKAVLISAIVSELGNHEFCITGDETETVEALDLDLTDGKTREAMKKAIRIYHAAINEN